MYLCFVKQLEDMGVAKDKKRFEVHLREDVVSVLQAEADKDLRSLKNFMENVLINYVNNLKK